MKARTFWRFEGLAAVWLGTGMAWGCSEDSDAAELDTSGGTGTSGAVETGDPQTSSGADGSTGRAEGSSDDTGSGSDSGSSDESGTVEACPDGPAVHCLLEELSSPYVDPNGSPGKAIGLVVGVATLEDRYVTGFGATTIGGDIPPGADSIFDIASVTKVYAGYLLARGIENGDVLLTHALEDTFGPDVPTWRGESIDVLDLATHTSGLPNYPDNMPNAGPVNPASGYTLELLEEFLASHTLEVAPETAYAYSNLGSGILGHVLVTAAGEDRFEALVQREIAEPYGLVDTRVDLDAEQLSRKLQGHAMGAPAPAIDIGDPLEGGGALRSTGDEVLRFFEGAIGGDDTTWTMVMVPRRPSPNGANAFTGFLLNVEDPDGETTYSKNGGAPGFSSEVVFRTEPAAVVVLLSNANSTQGLYALGTEILDALPTTSF